MPTARARVNVGNGPFTPLPYGLFSVADFPPLESHWANGVLRQPAVCSPAKTTLDPCGLGGAASITKSPSATGLPTSGADPFTVYAYIDCGLVGFNDIEGQTIEHLENGEDRAVERTFWTGSVSTTGAPLITPHLAANAQVIGPNGEISQLAATPSVTGAPVAPVLGLGLLENALGSCYGGVGVIHVTPATMTALYAAGAITLVNGQWMTANGHLVAAGAGYPGTSPAGVTPSATQPWMYATGAVHIRRGPITVTPWRESIDMAQNDPIVIAERTYVVDFDCCLHSVQVNLG